MATTKINKYFLGIYLPQRRHLEKAEILFELQKKYSEDEGNKYKCSKPDHKSLNCLMSQSRGCMIDYIIEPMRL